MTSVIGMVKKDAPVSSEEAAQYMVNSGKLFSQRNDTLTWVMEYGEATICEIAREAALDEVESHMVNFRLDLPEPIIRELVWGIEHRTKIIMGRRVNELWREGLIEKGDMRESKLTGRKAQAWRITDKGFNHIKHATIDFIDDLIAKEEARND